MRYKFRISYLLLSIILITPIAIVANFVLNLGFSNHIMYALVFSLSVSISFQINVLQNRKKLKHLMWLENRMKLWNNITYRVNIAGEEAFDEMPVAIILYDENYNIEWANKYAKSVFMSPLLNKEIKFINSDMLSKLEEGQTVFDLFLYGKVFGCDVRYENRIIYLMDKTKEIELANKLKNKTLAVGIINIDNINQALGSFDAQERAVHISNIIGILSDWAELNNVYIRGYSEERYLLLTNYERLQSLQRDRFKVIDEIKQYSYRENLRISLSIGIACKDIDKVKIVELAEQQLELALNRGGDQCVVIVDEEIFYYGARSNAIETRSTVSIRVKAEEIRDLIKDSSQVFVMSHAHMDADAFGSAIGLVKIVKSLGRESKIVFDSNSIDPTVNLIYKTIQKKHTNILEYFISPREALAKLTDETLLIIVDCQYKSILLDEKVYQKARKVAIIDHHRRSPEAINDYVFLYAQPSSSSSVELVTELMEYMDEEIEISSTVATWMLLGIIVDTNNFVYRTNHQTYNVLAKLNLYGADSSLVKLYLREDLEVYAKRIEILNNIEIYDGKYGIAISDDEVYERQFLAKIADSIISINNIEAGFAIGYIDKDLVGISARSIGQTNVQIIMETLGGGGHFNNAAVQLAGINLQTARDYLIEKIKSIDKGEGLTMKIILTKDVKGKGKVDDIIDVPAGHANFLIRSNQAIEATVDNIKQLENKQLKVQHEQEKLLQEMRDLKVVVEQKSVTVKVKVGKEGKLFGSVSTKQIVDEFKNQHNIELDKRKIIYDKDIDALGTYIIPIQLHKDVLAKITLYVVEKE